MRTAGQVLGFGRSVKAATSLGLSRTPAVGYVGWLGYQNLGDDVMYLALRARMPSVELASMSALFASRRLQPAIGRLMKRRVSSLMLGGGTQFCNRGWRGTLETIEQQTGPLPILPIGVGVDIGTHQSESPSAWASIFSRCDRVTVRGPRSQRLLAEFGIEAEIIGDTALLVEPPPRPAVRPGTVGINIGPVDPVPVSDEQLIAVATAIAREATALGYEPRWIAAVPEDIPLIMEARRRSGGSGRLVESFRDPLGFADDAAQCEVVASTKLHVAVLAALAGVPIVSLAYEQKCHDFAESLDCLDAVVDLSDEHAFLGKALSTFADVESNAPAWSRRLSDGVAALRPRLLARISEVEEAVVRNSRGR